MKFIEKYSLRNADLMNKLTLIIDIFYKSLYDYFSIIKFHLYFLIKQKIKLAAYLIFNKIFINLENESVTYNEIEN